MTAEEEEKLRELGRDLAATAQSVWQPLCIARAFARSRRDDLTLTMQGWIDLEAARSPLLRGEPPLTEPELEAAFAAFDLSHTALVPAEAAKVVQAMGQAIEAAFNAALRMVPPGAAEPLHKGANDGFGDWLPLLACLVTQCGLTLGAALGLPVGCAFMLIAALRRNEGWAAAGTVYGWRDLGEEPSKSLHSTY